MFVTGTTWNRRKRTPQLETIQKPADFIPGDPEMMPQGPQGPPGPVHISIQNPFRLILEGVRGGTDGSSVRLTSTAFRFVNIV